MNGLPLIYYPLTVAVVDDDPLFIDASLHILKDYPVISYDSPDDAIALLSKQKPQLPALKCTRGCTELEHYDLSGHLPVDLDLLPLQKMRCQTNPVEIGVVIVDYNMPHYHGIEVCRKLAHQPMKKILLTGQNHEPAVIDAFNEGIIDYFLHKDSPDLAENLLIQVNKLLRAYAKESTEGLAYHLETDHQLPFSDPIFVAFFEDFCKENQICAYFILDQQSNFLLKNNANQRFYFIIHNNRSLNNFCELHANDADRKSYVEAVQNREKIYFFGENQESWEVQACDWAPYFYKPSLLQGRELYYWTVIPS